MRMPKRGERGFTLIELLIVVAILGVLAAVIVPNVSRFFGRGEEEARKTEKHNVQLAVGMMMADNELSEIPNPVVLAANATQDMAVFPDATSVAGSADKLKDPEGYTYLVTVDKNGYLLYGDDITGSAVADPNPNQVDVNYMPTDTVEYYYTSDADGTVHQYDAAGGTEYID